MHARWALWLQRTDSIEPGCQSFEGGDDELRCRGDNGALTAWVQTPSICTRQSYTPAVGVPSSNEFGAKRSRGFNVSQRILMNAACSFKVSAVESDSVTWAASERDGNEFWTARCYCWPHEQGEQEDHACRMMTADWEQVCSLERPAASLVVAMTETKAAGAED